MGFFGKTGSGTLFFFPLRTALTETAELEDLSGRSGWCEFGISVSSFGSSFAKLIFLNVTCIKTTNMVQR